MRIVPIVGLGVVMLALPACGSGTRPLATVRDYQAVAPERPWCAIESGGIRTCAYDTREQCAASRQLQTEGGCFENPFYQPRPPGSADQGGPVPGVGSKPTGR